MVSDQDNKLPCCGSGGYPHSGNQVNPAMCVPLASTIALRVYSWVLFFLVLGLILKGALVTSHDAGLAVPDWPTTFGENMFTFHPSKWHGIIFFEHVHRLYASLVGLLTVGLAVWICLGSQNPPWLKIASVVAVGLVIVQGVLGGLTVLLLLPTEVSSLHAVVAQTFLLLILFIALSIGSTSLPVQFGQFFGRFKALAGGQERVARLLLIAIGLVYFTLTAGAVMRHMGAGLAIPDFPSMGGSYVPWVTTEMLLGVNRDRASLGLAPVESDAVWAHLLHRVGAISVLLLVGLLLVTSLPIRLPGVVGRLIISLGVAVVLQAALGVTTVLLARPPWIASLHVLVGAIILALLAASFIKLLLAEKSDTCSEVRG